MSQSFFLKNILSKNNLVFFILTLFLVSSCKVNNLNLSLGGSSDTTYTVGGVITGLNSGETLVLQNYGADHLTITGGGTGTDNFNFATPLTSGETYYIQVFSQPLTKTCVVGAGFGTVINSNVTNILVTCGSTGFIIGGNVTGLIGTGLVLRNNSIDLLSISADGAYSFARALSDGDVYDVNIASQPTFPAQFCSAVNGSGTINGADITNINISCTTNSYKVSGSIIGLGSGESLTLLNNGTDSITIIGAGSGNDPFTFPVSITDASNYSVSITSSPGTKLCSINNGSGVVYGGNVSSVTIGCIPVGMYSVGGTLSGLGTNATLVLHLASGENLSLTTNGNFTFTTPHNDLVAYSVSVQNPVFPSQNCTVTGGNGTIAAANVTNISVACVTNTFTASVTVSGLNALGGSFTIQNNGTGAQTISANGIYSFAAQLDATSYNISISNPSSNLNCTISNGTGTMHGANIMASIICNPVSIYSVGVYVNGTNISGGTGLKVQLNGTETSSSILTNSTYWFTTGLHHGDPYNVTIMQNPDRASGNAINQICSAIAPSGTISANVTVTINCFTQSYAVSGTVAGLAGGETTILSNNNSLVVTVTGGGSGTDSFAFTSQNDGSTFSISALSVPSGKSCAIGGSPGIITGANVDTVAITCSTLIPYTVGGTVNGLIGTGMVIRNNATNNLTINGNGGFTFSTPLYSTNPYSVTILTQPSSPAQTCAVSNASGSIAGANIVNVVIDCALVTYSVSGTVNGLNAGDQITLSNNGIDFTSFTSVGGSDNFYFNKPLNNGDNYSVLLDFAVPGNITCNSASGVVSGTNVVVVLTCQHLFYIGGTETGLPSGKVVVLLNNLGDTLFVSGTGAPTAFAFGTPMFDTSTYSVTINQQPPDFTCSVTNGAGTIAGADISNVAVDCVPKCGNGLVDAPVGETCDDSNSISGDGCSTTCQSEGTPVAPGTPTTFDDVTMQGWSATGLWHLSTLRSFSPSYSMHYASALSGNFDTGTTNTGALTSPAIFINPGLTTLSFYYFLNGECGNGILCNYDKVSVEVSTDSGINWTVIEYLPEAELGVINHLTSLAAYSGLTINIRFYFDSIDSVGNTYEGAYIDEITFVP